MFLMDGYGMKLRYLVRMKNGGFGAVKVEWNINSWRNQVCRHFPQDLRMLAVQFI